MTVEKKKKVSVWVQIAGALTAIASAIFGIYQIAKAGSVITVEAPRDPVQK